MVFHRVDDILILQGESTSNYGVHAILVGYGCWQCPTCLLLREHQTLAPSGFFHDGNQGHIPVREVTQQPLPFFFITHVGLDQEVAQPALRLVEALEFNFFQDVIFKSLLAQVLEMLLVL